MVKRIEFWIDVGGTFTDCLMRRDGEIRRIKVLSSGKLQGTIGADSSPGAIVDGARRQDPSNVWRGYRLQLLSEQGEPLAARRIVQFDATAGRMTLDRPFDSPPLAGALYLLEGDEEAPLVGMRRLLGLARDEALPAVDVRLGTTRGTNALLTRTGADVGFVTTAGFGDILDIGYQNRPQLFQLNIRKSTSLVRRVVELEERLAADGSVLVPLDEAETESKLSQLYDLGIRSLAITLLHGYRNPEHERQVEAIARRVGFAEVSASHEAAPLIKLVARGDTTVVDAYLNPILRDYVGAIQAALGEGSRLSLLTSAGGLIAAEKFSGKDSILSGPAGGVVGYAAVAQQAGFGKAIGFDMGGTSTDVSRFDGSFERQFETEKAGVRIVAPMMAIETVAAGGGSICDFDGVKLTVGPASAGADPGPACYGCGGPLTVTDINLALGKLQGAQFPFRLDKEAVERRLQEIALKIAATTGQQMTPRELASGFLQIANANIAKAIRTISVAKGYDPRAYALVPFGGAAGQHACAVAELLGIETLISHPDAGILSAVGIGAAVTTRYATRGVYRLLAGSAESLDAVYADLQTEAITQVAAEGIDQAEIECREEIELRYRGLEASLSIAARPFADLAERYHVAHERRYGYCRRQQAIEVVAARVEAIAQEGRDQKGSQPGESYSPEPTGRVPVLFAGSERETPTYQREQLRVGAIIEGPALIAERLATTVIDPGWSAEVWSGGELVMRHHGDSAESHATTIDADVADPVLLEIINNQFAAIAEQMGVALQNTSVSVNVKERLDFSCAIFTGDGDLIANAPHIPVHLGAMGETVKATIAANPQMRRGSAFVTNNPYRGGSHLPDVTVITPVYIGENVASPQFFAASRAHHAEIGGIAAGSMPSGSKTLAEEGVLIDNFQLMCDGVADWEGLEAILRGAKYPSRNVADNLADVAAQVAANQHGRIDLETMVAGYGLPVVEQYARHIQNAAATKTRAALARLTSGQHRFEDHLDDGSPIVVQIEIAGDAAVIDFTGTGPVLPGNLNANRAIVTAAVMYCLRSLLDEDIPLNQGVLEPVEIRLPECFLNPPFLGEPEKCAAVAGGNVETSQRVVDVLLGALQLAAASQGTMNNFSFGDATFGYYETICGGAGATPQTDGASAVHTHMTNTRMTDVEVFELRFPARVRRFAIRRGSGGAGLHRGGDGVVREIEFLRPMTGSLLTQRRGPYPPYGLFGGEPGKVGENQLRRADGTVIDLPGIASFELAPGDMIAIHTPGGGGWGSAKA
ncbi:hydantoinase B/oxoprolinase family protein [Blastopirellula sp. JC732]|uniref:Hydantoinase B/oxoprolinase family protein n=1 Tax=Blastopirellula sediminis TaxID=2894196 RepID=A0A9X1MNQ3_9BACT|nr:hydantoinase B/oxoprolinase family protein [Blastopirellula sediminis]MCC9608389.1 hydantoinase B/oxoprolinase family protein [Blastopirellula sediminis]MCC9628834.1 hydantoinase B/oxoprolinase family protein [Blastopirellula sediminis]